MGPLDRLARLDPTGVIGRRAVDVARRVPGVTAGERVAQRVEDAVLRELSRRLDEAAGRRELTSGDPQAAGPRGRAGVGSASAGSAGAGSAGTLDGAVSPAERMDALLRASIDQDPAAGERALVEMLIGELVPDEARMLAALSDGEAYPVIDVVARGGDEHNHPILANASSLGRQAGVVLPDRVPVYLGHLLSLGLVARGAADSTLGDEYDILLTDPALMAARAHSGSGLRRPRVVRGTVRISDLGRSVWAATRA